MTTAFAGTQATGARPSMGLTHAASFRPLDALGGEP